MNLRILDLLLRPILLLVLLERLAPVSAQTSNVTCQSSWSWTLNSRQQTPCLVAAYLLAPCVGGQWDVPPLQTDQYYQGPSVAVANQCSCSSVVYQLMSACGSCQGQEIIAWSTWKANCASGVTTVAGYPKPISSATSVPAWAYIDITGADRFNATVAHADLGQPESSAGSAPSATSSSTTAAASGSTTASASSTSPVSQVGNSNSGGGGTNTGAIVGGVVGGVVGLGLIACLILYLIKRNSQNTKRSAPSAEFSKVITPGSPVPANFDPAVVGFRSRTASPMSNGLSTNDSSTGGYGMQNMHHIAMNQGNGTGAPFNSPWSPPPVGHTPAPSSGHYSSIYTPPPPEMNQNNIYTPPPGSLGTGSVPSQPYSNPMSTGYNPTQAYPYSGVMHRPQHSNSSFNRPSGYPEM